PLLLQHPLRAPQEGLRKCPVPALYPPRPNSAHFAASWLRDPRRLGDGGRGAAGFACQRIKEAITVATAIRSSGKRPHPSREEIDPVAVALLERHGAQLMATARRYAATQEDAEDAYQRGVEILLTKAPNTDPAELLPWLKTVVKHEAFAVRKQAERHGTPSEPWDIEPHAGRAPAPADLAEHRDRLSLGTEAMKQLKPQEMRALMLRAEGLSYEEICAATGWTYTRVLCQDVPK